MAEINVLGLFDKAQQAAQDGFGALVSAKFGEAVARAERKTDTIRETVRAATVAPVQDVREANPSGVETREGMPGWMKGALIAAAALGAVLLLRRL